MSTIRVDNFAPSGGGTAFPTEGVAKIVCFMSNAAVIARATNVSSATDEGVGAYRMNFTNPMVDSDSAAPVTQAYGTSNGAIIASGSSATTGVTVFTRDSSNTLSDRTTASTGHGGLA